MIAEYNSSHHTNEKLHSTRIINMCIQHYTKCRNSLCQNTVHMLDVIECSSKPLCERMLVQVPLKKNSDRFHCESCEKIGPEERHRTNLARHKRERDARTKKERAKNSDNGRSLSTFPDNIESAETEDETHDAALTLLDMSRGQHHAQSQSWSGHTINSENEEKQSSLGTFPDKIRSAESKDEAHEAALILVAMSRGQYLAPSSSGSGHAEKFGNEGELCALTNFPDKMESAESEDEAHDAALILWRMSRGERPAPSPSGPGPKKARFHRHVPTLPSSSQQQPDVVVPVQEAQQRYRAILPRPPAYQRPPTAPR